MGSNTVYSSIREAENAIRKANNQPPVWQPGSALRHAINRGLPFCGVQVEYLERKAWGNDPNTELRFLKDVADHLGIKRKDDWYAVMWKHMSKAPNGSRLLNQHGNSVLKVLQALMPKVEWIEWKFSAVPNGFWDVQENRMRYMEWLCEQCGCKNKDDVRALKTKDFQTHRGMGFLRAQYGNTPHRAVKEYLEWLTGW